MTALQTYNIQQFARLTQALSASTPTTQPSIETLLSESSDPKWTEKRRQIHNAVAVRNAAARQRMGGRIADNVVQPQPSGAAIPSIPMDDPRWRPYFYGPNDALTGWNDPYGDPFSFQNGGGVYLRSDTRVNRYNDSRMYGDFDRRVNIDYDRRTDIHVDPRHNY
jgi:hypothetical protein